MYQNTGAMNFFAPVFRFVDSLVQLTEPHEHDRRLRAGGLSIGENTNILSYTDVADLSEYAISAMQWAVGAGIITGTGDGSTLSPHGQATRAQAAVMLMRFCEEYVTW